MKEKRIYPHRPYKAVANLSNTTEEQKQNVIELYTSGLSQTQIEKDLKMTRKTIRTILKEVDQDRTKSQQWRLRYGSTLNENAFETLTPESEYWIGFLYADGHILGHRGYAVEVGVHTHDKEHLDKFKHIITSDNKPYGLHRTREQHLFEGEKIFALRKCPKEPHFTYTDFDCYVSRAFLIIQSKRINLKYITGLLNSKLIAFWLRKKGKMQGNNYQLDKDPLLDIPIYKPLDTEVNEIAELVDLIISLIKFLTKYFLCGLL